MKPEEIVQIVISGLTLLVTALVPIMIYWLQKRHEKEIEAIRNAQEAKELENKANEFLIDHENERDYLPWCTIATALHRHEHHTRGIYTDFCRCPLELQQEILKQAGFEIAVIEDDKWIERGIDFIREFIKNNNWGSDFLYGNAKYFHRNFEYYRDLGWKETPRLFEPIETGDKIRESLGIKKVSFGSYIDDYMWYRRNNRTENEPIPPIDYIEMIQNLRNCEEKVVCKWIMEIVYYATIYIHNTTLPSKDELWNNTTDAVAETYEDRYYETLLMMYFTFK